MICVCVNKIGSKNNQLSNAKVGSFVSNGKQMSLTWKRETGDGCCKCSAATLSI